MNISKLQAFAKNVVTVMEAEESLEIFTSTNQTGVTVWKDQTKILDFLEQIQGWEEVKDNFKIKYEDEVVANQYLIIGKPMNDYLIGDPHMSYSDMNDFIKNNRLEVIVMVAYFKELNTVLSAMSNLRFDYTGMGFRTQSGLEGIAVQTATQSGYNIEHHRWYRFFSAIATMPKMNKEQLIQGLATVKSLIARNNNYIQNTDKPGAGLEKAILKHRSKEKISDIWKESEEAVSWLIANMQNAAASRTWGWEVEVPDAKGIDAPQGVQKGEDGSLRSYESENDCECNCDECYYHSCNCEHCETGSEDPDHCGNLECASADMAEYRTIGGIPTTKHHALNWLCDALNNADAEKNDTAGTHIHVHASDLTAQQVAQVLVIYKHMEQQFAAIAGREDVGYASKLRFEMLSKALKKHNPVFSGTKQVAVNVNNLQHMGKQTIEFRQMDCNLDADKITAWAWLVRNLVTAAQRGATFSDFKDVTTLRGYIDKLKKYGITPQSENANFEIPGNKMWKSVGHKVLNLQFS